MSNLLDLTAVKESGPVLHPEGEYTVTCTEAELKSTKAGTGKYIECKFISEDGTVWDMFNIINNSEKAQEIGRGQLKTFLRCSGADVNSFDLDNIRALEGLKCNAVIKHKEDAIYGKGAKISYFKPVKEIVREVKQADIPF